MKIWITLLGASLVLSACGARRIPGTDIEDNDDTRAILQVMEQYRSAVEARDADGVRRLLSDSFKDEGGTSRAEDRMDYRWISERLPAELNKHDDLKLDISVRKIIFHPEDSTASAIFTYSLNFRMPRLSNKPQNDSDIKEMWFKREKSGWKIVSGI
jgi:hypothetical protein